MIRLHRYVPIFLIVFHLSVVKIESLSCLMCQNLYNPSTCNKTVICPGAQQCDLFANPCIIGLDVQNQQSAECHECCSTDICNSLLCKNKKGTNGWSQWATWGSCSVTCGVGMQRRDRSCSQQSLTGDNCFGESRDYRICMPKACVDGAWSDWGDWGSCSQSCGGGVQSRSRTCTNPRPSMLGRYCDGDSNQMMMCGKNPCPDLQVYQNYGNSYNNSTGEFTCHVPGTSCNIWSVEGTSCNCLGDTIPYLIQMSLIHIL